MADVEAGSDVAIAGPRRIDGEWRRWIAENLMLEVSPETIIKALVAQGFSAAETNHEIGLALQSPYFRAADRLRNRLRKRNWLLATYRKLGRLHPASGEIRRRHKLSRSEFFEDYYCLNRPVIITGMMDEWPALRKWSLDYFDEHFGDREVEVQCDRDARVDHAELERTRYALGPADAVLRLHRARSRLGDPNDSYMTANNSTSNKSALPELWDDIIQIPEYLAADSPLDGFFWLGPAGTITPFHHDLTNNLMAQVFGRKRVKVVPSWDLPLMRNSYHVYCQVDGRSMPPAPHADLREPQVLECVLSPGEILFLPVGSLHFVEALDISATVSFTNLVVNNDFVSFYTTFQTV